MLQGHETTIQTGRPGGSEGVGMTIDAQMHKHGFVPWRALHGAQGYLKTFRNRRVASLVLMPVTGKSIQQPNDQVLACYFDQDNRMCSDRFYDSLLTFLERNSLDTSLLHHPERLAGDRLLPAFLGSLFQGFGGFVRRKLLWARQGA